MFQNNNTPEIYLEKCLSNMQVKHHKECGIWLDDRTIVSELKIKRVQASHGIPQVPRR